MGWTETCAMDERARFVLAAESGEETMAALCRRFGVSRQNGYKWLARYAAEGVGGLAYRSRAPLGHPQALSAEEVEHCLAVRRQHPSWGPVKVRAFLGRRLPDLRLPAASTIGALFDREGLTVRRRHRRVPPGGAPFSDLTAANQVWCIDFKGWFRTGDGRRCEPLTLSDAHSRCCCQRQPKVVARVGLPAAIRSDNGPPFASTGAGGLTRLAVHWLKLGIRLERTDPASPQQNGRHERPPDALQDTAATGAEPEAAARAAADVPAPLQRGAAARSARQRDAGRALRRLAAALRRHPARAGLRRRGRGAAGALERPDQVARPSRPRQQRAGRRAGRPFRDRGRRLAGALRAARARCHRPPRRAPRAAAQRGPWTCGQR
jgi:transposase